MNPVFWLLVIVVAVILWFLLAFIFYPLGRLIYRIVSDAISEINREDKGKDDSKQ